MNFTIELISKTLFQVWGTFVHNWPFLIVSIFIAALLKLYLDPAKISAFLQRYRNAGVIGATAAAVTTPLCSCGTMAILIGMMASTIPWAPIIAFMVASPLTSPEELVYSAGLFGWPFAIAFFVSSILLGLAGGMVAGFMENRGWLKNQARYVAKSVAAAASTKTNEFRESCSCNSTPVVAAPALAMAEVAACGCGSSSTSVRATSVLAVAEAAVCGCGSSPAAVAVLPDRNANSDCCGAVNVEPKVNQSSEAVKSVQSVRVSPRMILDEVIEVTKRLIPMFFIFAFIGYFLNGLIPTAWVAAIFGAGNVYSIPLAATLGLPLYINTEASLPLVRALIDGGMSQGSALAFLITGAGTSIGALTGALTIARWRVIAIVVGTLWVGAIVMGYLYNIMLATSLI